MRMELEQRLSSSPYLQTKMGLDTAKKALLLHRISYSPSISLMLCSCSAAAFAKAAFCAATNSSICKREERIHMCRQMFGGSPCRWFWSATRKQ